MTYAEGRRVPNPIGRLPTHGRAFRGRRSPEYTAWSKMLSRCRNPRDPSFENYGARGISVCARWVESFAAFLADVGLKPSRSHSIDRIDVNGGYEPHNVKWSTRLEQNRNRRSRVAYEHDGRSLCAGEWAERTGIPERTISARIQRYGWDVASALTTPVLQPGGRR